MNLKLEKVGIVGSGQIGPDIALHMSKVLSESGTRVIVVDVDSAAIEQGRQKLDKKIDKGLESKAFRPEQAERMKEHVEFTLDYERIRGAEFVIEAATENLELKRRIFSQLETLTGPEAILASNSSHLEPERIFAEAARPERALVIHYFFPAERNPLVEIVPAAETGQELVDRLMGFYESIGKVPIRVGSRYGYAIDPIFEGLFQAAALCVEDGLGSTKEVDWVARRSLGLGVGPFTAMNLTGGNPITAHGLDELHERVHPWFKTPSSMHQALETGRAWDVAKRGETVEIDEERERSIAERMEGSYFGLVGEILDSGISSVADLEMGAQIGLVIDPPFSMMNRVGVKAGLERVREVQKIQPEFPLPACLVEQAAAEKPFEIPYLERRDRQGPEGAVAVIVIRRPAVLNALNGEVYAQLLTAIESIDRDDGIVGAVVTGFGRKAFVSGADIGMLASIENRTQAEATSRSSHRVMNAIENCTKPIVCAYNGLAFGGGNELGMACHARIARSGLKILAAQPEPNLGIIPGAGATQRLPRWIGIEPAWDLLRTGRAISGREALGLGLISEEVSGDLVERAVELVRELVSGKQTLARIRRTPIEVSDPSDVDIQHRSKAVDAILRRVILDGASMDLEKGLELEIQGFGDCAELEDMRIGVDNFVNKGPRSKAEFVHR